MEGNSMISGIAIKLFLGGMLKRLSAAFRWCVAHPALTALIITLVALWWQHGALQEVRKDLLAMTKARDAEIATHRATKANYRHAQAEAAEQDRLNKERVEKEHAHILEVAQSRYAADLSAARSGFAERLRNATTRSCSTGEGGNEAMSPIPVLSTGTMQDGGDAIVSSADAELGLENSIRLRALIEAWKKAAAVGVDSE